MNKNKLLTILNPVLGVLIINQAFFGMVHDAVPEGVFEVMHEGGGVVLLIGVVLHVILNWGWVRMNVLKKKRVPVR